MLNQLTEETQYWFQYQQQYILKNYFLQRIKKNCCKILEKVSMMEGKAWSYNKLNSYKVVLYI
jgi:hypothetical protein